MNCLRVTSSQLDVGQNLSGLQSSSVDEIWQSLADTKCKKLHWIGYKPRPKPYHKRYDDNGGYRLFFI